ncbi:DUF4249 domain-containing protein [Bacteroidota bacterium]
MKKLLYITSIILFFASCEEVIDINLDSAEPHIVIEGTITNEKGPYTIKITRTTDYFNPTESSKVSSAIVNISDDQGNEETLVETSPGIYQTSTIEGVIGRTYYLNVNIDGTEYKASSYMPDTTYIDFISYDNATAFQGEPEDYYVLTFFHDIENIENYYRLKLYINSELDEFIYLTDDEWQDGLDITFGLLAEKAVIGDTIVIELMNIDQQVYDYYTTLNSLLEDMFIFASTPANPNSNISNGALGYFGAYSFTRDTVIIQ